MSETHPKLRVALVGCGQIADAHLQEIARTGCAQVVAVCDRQGDLARQAALRFGVPAWFECFDQLLTQTCPEVVHITTPPQTHLPVALEAVAGGAHVYIEKPFAVDLPEARRILNAADGAGKLVCVGHDQLFDPIWLRARRLVGEGQLGRIVHIDSLMGYNLGGPFGRVLSSEPEHWVHSLPGGLFQNNISHAVYRITDFLEDGEPRIWATSFGEIGGSGRPSELRVLMAGENATAQLIFSSAMRPLFRMARLHGTRCSIEVDMDAQAIRRYRTAGLPGAFAKLELPARDLAESARNLLRNMHRFMRSDIHYFAGMRELFGRFYESILRGTPPPITHGEILRVTSIMDRIFQSCTAQGSSGHEIRQVSEPRDDMLQGDRGAMMVPAASGRNWL